MATLQIDTRQQESKHEEKHGYFRQVAGLHLVRTKLLVGDYMLVGGTVSVDTKQHILELCSNIDNDHERFRKECVTARECGIRLVVLVENDDGVSDLRDLANWKNPRRFVNASKGLRPPIDGKRLAKACATMSNRYGVEFDFCQPCEAGARVLSILGVRDG